MAKAKIDGLEAFAKTLKQMEKAGEKIAGHAVYKGAGVVADTVRQSINALPEIKGYGTEAHPLAGGVTSAQKKGLQDGLGISTMQTDAQGGVNVKIGFNGYNATRTKKFPAGQPNVLIARGVESGTSWKRKRPFFLKNFLFL